MTGYASHFYGRADHSSLPGSSLILRRPAIRRPQELRACADWMSGRHRMNVVAPELQWPGDERPRNCARLITPARGKHHCSGRYQEWE